MQQNGRVEKHTSADQLDGLIGRENGLSGRGNGHSGNGHSGNGHTRNGRSLNGRNGEVEHGSSFDQAARGTGGDDGSEQLWFRSNQHDAVIASIRRLIEANKEVRRTMQANERVLQRTLRSLEGGHGIAGTFARVPTSAARQASTESERALLRARHQLRLTVFAAGLAEGMSIAELARCWGFSRQLGARYVKEIRTRRPELVPSAAGGEGAPSAETQPA